MEEEDKQVKRKAGEIDDFEFDDEFVDLFDQLGDILNTEATESGTVEVSQTVTKPNEPTMQEIVLESQVLAEVAKKTDITLLAKNVFDVLQSMKQNQSVAVVENSSSIASEVEPSCSPTPVELPDYSAEYALLKEKYRRSGKRHRKTKGTPHRLKGKKSRGHKLRSDEYKRYKLMREIKLLDNALVKRHQQGERDPEIEFNARSEFEGYTRNRGEHVDSEMNKNDEFYVGHWEGYNDPPPLITSDDLRNKLRLSSKRSSRKDLDRSDYQEPKRDPKDRKLNSRRQNDFEEPKPSRDSGSSKVRSVCVSSSDDVLRRGQEAAKNEVEPVSSSTSVRKTKVSKPGSSRHSSSSGGNTITIVKTNSVEEEIITSMGGITPVKKHRKKKKKTKPESKKKSKTESKVAKIKDEDELTASRVVSRVSNGRARSPQTYEVFDIAPFESGNLDIEIISENFPRQKVDSSRCGKTVQGTKVAKVKSTQLIVLDSPGRDSTDSITSAKTVHRSRSVESIASIELETTKAINKIKKLPSLAGEEETPLHSEASWLSYISTSPLLSESSSSKILLRSENPLLESQFRKSSRSSRSEEDLSDDLSESLQATNEEVLQSPQHREKSESPQRDRRSNEPRKATPPYQDREREKRSARKSPQRRRTRDLPHSYKHSDNPASHYRKTSRSRSPPRKRSRSPYTKMLDRYKSSRAPYRKRSRSRSPYRRKHSASPSRLRKSRSPYKRALRSRSPYRRPYSPPKKTRRSKSPLKKRFEEAVASLLPQLGNKTTNFPEDSYAASAVSFIYKHGPLPQHNINHYQPQPQHPLAYAPRISENYHHSVPPNPYPSYNSEWVCPPTPMPPMAYNSQMPLLPPGVAPYPSLEQPMMPPHNHSFPLPVPAPHQPPIILPRMSVPPPNVSAFQPPTFSRLVAPGDELQTSCPTSTTEPSDCQLEPYSPSQTPPSSPIMNQPPSFTNDVDDSSSESLSDATQGMQQTAGGTSCNKPKHSPIIMRLNQNLRTLISTNSLELGNSPISVKLEDMLDTQIPTNSEQSSKSLAIPLEEPVLIPPKDNTSTCEVKKLNESVAIPVASLTRKSDNPLNKNKPRPVSSNRIVIGNTNPPCQTVNKLEIVQTNGSNNSQSLTQSQILEQVIKLLSISKRAASTQVNFIGDSLCGSDEVFKVEPGDNDDLLNNLRSLLK